MDKKYHVGVLDDDYSKKFRDVKNALLETGLVSQGTPDAMITKELSNGLEDLTPQNIKLGVTIAGVDGKMRSSLSDWDVDSLLNMDQISYTYTYSDKKHTLYGKNSMSGLFLYNKETKEHKQIFDKGRIFKYYLETFDGDVYIMCYDSVLLTSYVLYIDIDFNCSVVYESTKVNFSTDNAGMHQSSAGHCYFDSGYYTGPYSYNTSTYTGIYYLNKSEPAKQIYGVTPYEEDNGVAWSYPFEDSKGNVYVGSNTSNSSSTGILYLNGAKATKIYTSGYYWQYFLEDSNGNVYVGSNSSSNGILYLNGATATQIYTTGYNLFEDSKGNVYVGSKDGVLKLNGETATLISSIGSYLRYFFEDSKGNVYASSDSSSGVFHLNGEIVTQIYTSGPSWRYFFEDSKGNVYVSSNHTSNSNGILHLNDTTATQIYTSGYSWYYYFEDSKGNVYVGNSSSDNGGIVHLDKNNANLIYPGFISFKQIVELKGKIYICDSGDVYLSDDICIMIDENHDVYQILLTKPIK